MYYTCIYIHICVYILTCKNLLILCIHTMYDYIYTYIYIYNYIYTYIVTCMYTHMCMYIYIYPYCDMLSYISQYHQYYLTFSWIILYFPTLSRNIVYYPMETLLFCLGWKPIESQLPYNNKTKTVFSFSGFEAFLTCLLEIPLISHSCLPSCPNPVHPRLPKHLLPKSPLPPCWGEDMFDTLKIS